MASSTSLLSEEQFHCPICLDMFTRPVSTPCGHNYCMACIESYWDGALVCQCPVCKERFEMRPHLKVNTFISELKSQFMLLQVTDQLQVNSGSVVLCDICIDTQQEAVKSCLECLTSYCEVHLEPHHRAAGLRKHTLVNPVTNLEDKICKEHNRLLVMFCRGDGVLLCDVCTSLQHVSHDVVPVLQAYKQMSALLGDTEAKVQQMVQERQQKVQAMKESIKQSKRETEDVVTNNEQELATLLYEIQKSHAELVKVVKKKQKASEEQVEGFISGVESEIMELQITMIKLRELKQTEDQLRFLQNFPNSPLLPHTMDLSLFSFNRHLEAQHIQKSLGSSVSQLRMLLNQMNAEISKFAFSDGTEVSNELMLRYMQQYEVNVSLDLRTANPLLILSDNCKEVRYGMGSGLWINQNLNPNMFSEHLAVLGTRGFSSQKFYFEVFVGRKTEWCLGVATASLQRKGGITRTPHCGLWAIWFLEDKFETFSAPGVPVYLGKVQRVGVFVDYDVGQVSFYDIQRAALIYLFSDCSFTEQLYPYFNPCDNEYGSNLDPMVIVPVSCTE
ncbi:nuclear factor 7, brain-like [Channa argus]|uniref:nuclear factor 7, brain-like n=1 Tax=Channa argus TaxID=215402 RepID=UPI00352005E1